MKIGKAWAIPDNAKKPSDARIHTGKYCKRCSETGNYPVVRQLPELINQVFEADCLKKMQEIPDAAIDMILCDLPYGVTQNAWDSYIPLDKLWMQYSRIIKPNGAIVLTSSGLFTAMIIMSQPALYKYKLVWEKSKPTNFLNVKSSHCANMRIFVYFIKSSQLIIHKWGAALRMTKEYEKTS